MTPAAANSFSYAVFSFVTDPPRDVIVPIGVALWSPVRRWAELRVVTEQEQVTGFDSNEFLPFVRLVESKLKNWMTSGKLPYSEKAVAPFTDDWWRHARELLIHRVRLSEPRAIDCRDPDRELERLYETIVAPCRPARQAKKQNEKMSSKGRRRRSA